MGRDEELALFFTVERSCPMSTKLLHCIPEQPPMPDSTTYTSSGNHFESSSKNFLDKAERDEVFDEQAATAQFCALFRGVRSIPSQCSMHP